MTFPRSDGTELPALPVVRLAAARAAAPEWQFIQGLADGEFAALAAVIGP